MIYFYKVVKIDTDAERARIARVPRYPNGARKALLQVLDLIDTHNIHKAYRTVKAWTTEWREFVGTDIWDLMWNYTVEQNRPVGRVELERLWKQRDKKGLPS